MTVPVLFEFQKYPNEIKSTRQKWLESEVQKKKEEEQMHLDTRVKPTDIPMSTIKPLYKILLKKDAKRRIKNREASMAENKAKARPFSFHERDIINARGKALNDDVDDHMLF